MIEYPKIETLYDRDEKTRKVITDHTRHPEFSIIKEWHVTEKVDGTNVRVALRPDGTVFFGGRTDNAQMPVILIDYLRQTFTPDKMSAAFATSDGAEVTLFGEGYGEKIQNGGAYRKGVSFRLFDALVGAWWLEPDAILDVAGKLGIQTVPVVPPIHALPSTRDELAAILGTGQSIVARDDGGTGVMAEGIVARTWPALLTRRGQRVVWKLKFKDF